MNPTSCRLTACTLLLLFASFGTAAQQVRVLPRGTPLSLVTVDGCRFEWDSNIVAMKEARALKAAEASQCVGGLATGYWVVGVQALSYRTDSPALGIDFVLAARFLDGKAVGLQLWVLETSIYLAHVRSEERIGIAFRKSNNLDTAELKEISQAIDTMALQTTTATEGHHVHFLKTVAGIWLNDPAGLSNELIAPFRNTPWSRGTPSATGKQPSVRQQDDAKTVGRGARGG